MNNLFEDNHIDKQQVLIFNKKSRYKLYRLLKLYEM